MRNFMTELRNNIVDGISEITIESMLDFNTIVNGMLDFPHYVWRGQKDSKWLLEPTLNRVIKNTNGDHASVIEKHLARFRYATRGRRGNNPRNDLTNDEWWALGQHHGLSTPLLDWTSSPYVAAFFSFSEENQIKENEYSVVYALNKNQVEIQSKQLSDEVFTVDDVIKFIKPFSDDNPRLLNQSGLFTNGPIGIDLESWVRTYFKNSKKAVLMKIKIPNTQRVDFLKSLNRMNINHLTLFPDLEGSSMFSNMAIKIAKYLE
jgi:hypothetical protein